MRNITLVRVSIISFVALMLLIAIGLMMTPIGSAQSIGFKPIVLSPPPNTDQSVPMTDTRWIELVQSASTKSQSVLALPTINIHVTDGLIVGRVSSAATVNVSVTRDSDLIAIASVTPFPDGASFMYATSLYCGYPQGGGGGGCWLFQVGDVVWVNQGNTTISMTVPTLNGYADTSNDLVYGTAPPTSAVTIYLYPFTALDTFYTQTVTTDANGQYQTILTPTIDVRPRDNGYVAFVETPDRVAYARFVAPFLRVQVNGKEISGYASPRSSVIISVTKANSVAQLLWSSSSRNDGAFEAYSDYWPLLQFGDHVTVSSAGQTFSTTIMTITAHINLVSGQVSGEALPNAPIDLLRFNGPLCSDCDSLWRYTPDAQMTITSTALGQYTASLPITRPNYGAAIITMADGHQTYTRFAVPYLAVRMGAANSFRYQATGQVDAASLPITIAIQGPSGYFKDVRHVVSRHTGYFTDEAGGTLILDTGDAVTMTTPQGVQAAVILPQLTGAIDPATDMVSGTAPPNARLMLTLYFYDPVTRRVNGGGGFGPTYSVVVTATAQGEYQVNLHGVIDLHNQSIAEVQMTLPNGHAVSRVFGAIPNEENCRVQLRSAYIGSSRISFATAQRCYQYVNLTLRLRDAQGRLKASQPWTIYPGGYGYEYTAYFYSGTQLITIMPADTIEIEWHSQPELPTATPAPIIVTVIPPPTYAPTLPPIATSTPHQPQGVVGDQIISITVPLLTVHLDSVANAITGQAPASAIVRLDAYRGSGQLRTMTATVNASGLYTASLNGLETLMSGDRAWVSYASPESILFYRLDVLPLVRVPLGGMYIDGWLTPNTPFTASLDSPRVITTVYTGRSYDEGQMSAALPRILPGDTVVITMPQQVIRVGVPQLSAQIDRATATIFGQAPPNARLRVDLQSHGRSQVVTATANGLYTVTFTDAAPLSNARGTLTYFDANSHQVYLNFQTLHWDITLDSKCVSGSAEVGSATITVTLQSAAGVTKGVFTALTDSYGGYFNGCFTTAVQSTDRLVLSYLSGATVTFTVPLLTARHDYASQALVGRTIPNQTIVATFGGLGYYSTRSVLADANGNYGVDTSDLHPRPGDGGNVTLTDELGNITRRNFPIIGYRVFLPIVRK